jgi:hypothetical protein
MNMITPAQMSVIHSVQRPLFSKLLWPIYPPSTGKATVRASADRILDIEPPAQVMGVLRKKPARCASIGCWVMVVTRPESMTKIMTSYIITRYTGLRPTISGMRPAEKAPQLQPTRQRAYRERTDHL